MSLHSPTPPSLKGVSLISLLAASLSQKRLTDENKDSAAPNDGIKGERKPGQELIYVCSLGNSDVYLQDRASGRVMIRKRAKKIDEKEKKIEEKEKKSEIAVAGSSVSRARRSATGRSNGHDDCESVVSGTSSHPRERHEFESSVPVLPDAETCRSNVTEHLMSGALSRDEADRRSWHRAGRAFSGNESDRGTV